MREIKFKAWDEGNKIMHYDFQFITSGENGNDWICFTSDKEPRKTDDPKGIIFNNPYFRQQIKIMQFTGLRDKNGEEMYEGDIFKNGSLVRAITVDEQHGYRFHFGLDRLTRGDADYGTVIGNIYENPELLK